MSEYLHVLALLAGSAHALPQQVVSTRSRALIETEPQRKEAYLFFALYLAQQGNLAEAHQIIDQALLSCPPDPELFYLKGRLSDETLAYTSSIEFYRRCLELAPHHRKALFHLSLALLTTGNIQSGAELYNFREFPEETLLYQKLARWNGADIAGSVLLWAEQGLGDELMFFRLLPRLESYHCGFAIQCDPRLIRLLSVNFPKFSFVPRNQQTADLSAFSAQAPIGDLLSLFYRDLSDASLQNRFLKPLAKPQWDEALRSSSKKIKIGISWLSMNPERGVFRSVPLEALLSSLNPERHRIINLQYLAPPSEIQKCEQRGFEVFSNIDCFQDIEGMAYAITCCDAVITIDNSTLHLSGALGARTFALLPREPNWRWQWNRDSTAWYPSVTLLRQGQAGDWSAPLEGLKSL